MSTIKEENNFFFIGDGTEVQVKIEPTIEVIEEQFFEPYSFEGLVNGDFDYLLSGMREKEEAKESKNNQTNTPVRLNDTEFKILEHATKLKSSRVALTRLSNEEIHECRRKSEARRAKSVAEELKMKPMLMRLRERKTKVVYYPR
ncbi:uncharacterized protein LOC107982044 [Nasonia vitripennis]|uniref:Uncharacterized protein n=1 Tax=Nasonia vitripennis TaxID=7425 RepID=A0A7M7J7U0_NASVI|nr:uncharacterized protein LOC107982044 [Nasonia vitripennis]